ncbi:MAG TPA: LacI family DNA-binding transcriptional regulator, partial [Acidimicrobiales bacterium]|nr:LacI family DNA-binding transcriptional regulator [Acidimicrobiales bacterium]
MARAANVSVSTVSRVIRGRDDVSDETRGAIQRVIEDLGYRPSGVARALVTGYSRTIALLVSNIANPFYPQLAKSVEQEARKAGHALVICNTGDSVEESTAYIRRLLGQGIDGVIHASVGLDEDKILELMADRRRIVFVNRRPRSRDVSYVVADNRKGAAALVKHLVDLGHRRIGFVGGPSWASQARDRLEGFTRAIADAGVQGLVVKEGDFSMESGTRAIEEWLASGDVPTAIIGVNDSVAIGAINGLLAKAGGLAVAVAGFDDTNLA